MSQGWLPISTAPLDGTPIQARRVFDGRVVYEGPGVFHEMRLDALHDPLSGAEIARAETVTGWGYPSWHEGYGKRIPEPTHWRPEGVVSVDNAT